MNSNDVLEKCVLAINFIALHLCIALSTVSMYVTMRYVKKLKIKKVENNCKLCVIIIFIFSFKSELCMAERRERVRDDYHYVMCVHIQHN